ncbi:hypothetical protein ACWGRV_08075 [Streptomyces sp. NPDC055663]
MFVIVLSVAWWCFLADDAGCWVLTADADEGLSFLRGVVVVSLLIAMRVGVFVLISGVVWAGARLSCESEPFALQLYSSWDLALCRVTLRRGAELAGRGA